MARERERRDERRSGEMRGEHRHHDGRDPWTESHERHRRGGGSYDAGPGREGLPDSMMMDRPRTRWASGAYARTGEARRGYDSEQPRIQEADRRGT